MNILDFFNLEKIKNIDLGSINLQELIDGVEIEKEHSDNKIICLIIALGHLAETPDYYTKLKKAGL